MNYVYTNATARNSLLAAVINEFDRGSELVARLDDRTYATAANRTGSVGGHFRHNLDFAGSFLNGIKTGQIDYNLRERDVRVEENRHYAKERFCFVIKRLNDLSNEMLGRTVMVRSEIDAHSWHLSSVSRELEFLHSHTVHHHALIAEKLAGFGIEVPRFFGVAPSTIEYWAELEKAA